MAQVGLSAMAGDSAIEVSPSLEDVTDAYKSSLSRLFREYQEEKEKLRLLELKRQRLELNSSKELAEEERVRRSKLRLQ